MLLDNAQPKPHMKTHENSTRVKAPALTIPDVQASPTMIDEAASLNPTGRGQRMARTKESIY